MVSSAAKARRLLDEVGSPWLKVVIDPANLFRPGELAADPGVLDEAFDWLGPDIVLAHAKELDALGRPPPATWRQGNGVLTTGSTHLGCCVADRSPLRLAALIVHGLARGGGCRVGARASLLRTKLESSARTES